MDWPGVLYVTLLVVGGAVSIWLSGFTWYRRGLPGAKSLALVMLASAFWSLCYTAELISNDLPSKVFWAKMKYFGVVGGPVAWLAVAHIYIGRERWLTPRNLALLGIVPLITLLTVWTSDWHGLFWSNVRLETVGGLSFRVSKHGPWYWFLVTYSYLLIMYSTILVLYSTIRTREQYRAISVVILIGVLMPLMGNVFYVFGYAPFTHLDLTSFGFTATGLAGAFAMLRFRFLDLVPVAHHAVIESMTDALIVLDDQNRIVEINPTARNLIGPMASNAVGEKAEKILSAWPELVEKGHNAEPYSEISLHHHEIKLYFDLHISPLYNPRGRLTGRLFLLHDITERKLSEETLRRRDAILEAVSFAAERLLRTFSWEEGMKEVIGRLGQATEVSRVYISENHTEEGGTVLTKQRYEWVADGMIPQVDKPELPEFSLRAKGFARWEAMLGRGQLIQGNVRELPAGEQDVLAAQHIKSILVVPIFVGEEWWGFIGFDEYEREREWSAAEVDALKTAAETLGAAIHRQQVEEELRQSKEAAEAASRSKSDFLANMSHELRTPLNHIIGFTELVVDKRFGDLNEVQGEYLNDALQSSRHLLSLINDILDLSKVEAGKLELEAMEIPLRSLLQGSLGMVKEKALKHKIRLSSDINGIPEVIQADERKLKQILYNLLSNAAKFTPDGGSVTLSARYLSFRDGQWLTPDGQPIRLPLDGDGLVMKGKGLIEISVQDSGIGIKGEDLERIFDPFEQVESSASRKYQGSGLGLSLTKRLVELHGGKIWAESEGQGKGSKFILVIPA